MKSKLYQTKVWEGKFGDEYTKRNTFNSYSEWNTVYKKRFGITKENLNKIFLNHLSKEIRILEIGCNIGNQLKCLYKIGFKKLSGIDIQHDCLQKIKKNFNSINSIEATVYNLPFKSNSFDLVFTNNVLVHIPPKKLKNVLREMYRVSESWIWGSEYYSKNYKKIIYRGNKNLLWKANFANIFLKRFKDLRLIKHKFLINKLNNEETDSMFLLKKK